MRKFTYLVTRTDPDARCMDVLYVADGYEPVLVGVRAPVAGEDRDQLLKQCAPTGIWDAIDIEKLPMDMPEVGTSGRIEPPVLAVAEPVPEIILRKREVTL